MAGFVVKMGVVCRIWGESVDNEEWPSVTVWVKEQTQWDLTLCFRALCYYINKLCKGKIWEFRVSDYIIYKRHEKSNHIDSNEIV